LSIWHVVPLNPVAHAHVNELIALVHVPPFWQGDEAQLLAMVAQVGPLVPATQLQVNPLSTLVHVPPF